MVFAFIAFGVLTLNMVSYVVANADYLLTYKWMAFVDGGARQLLEIWLTTFLALGCYLVFKLCEHALIERVAHQPQEAHHAAPVAEIVEPEANSALH